MSAVRISTGLGDILVRLQPDRAPRTVAAFLEQVGARSYEGGDFWRMVRADNDRGSPVIEIAQARCRPGIEPRIDLAYETSGIRHEDGTISLPRDANGVGSAHSFFICIGAQPALDEGGGRAPAGRGFAAFGRVIAGMDVVRAIHRIATVDDAPTDFMRGQVAANPVPLYRIERVAAATAHDTAAAYLE